MVGDDGQCLDGDARELAADRRLGPQMGRQVGRGADRPAAVAAKQVDAAIGIERRELGHQRLDVGVLRQLGGDGSRINRLRGGEQDGLDEAQVVVRFGHRADSLFRR